MKSAVLVLMSLLGACASARADEALFGYVYTTDPMPQGHWEYEQWNTIRSGKAEGAYTAFDLSNEMEYGFTENFTASFYLNSSYVNQKGVPDSENTTQLLPNRGDYDINGASIEMRYRVLSAYKDPIGLSLYLEPEISARDSEEGNPDKSERGLEMKLIGQKNFLEDQIVLAVNAMIEPEWERELGVPEKEMTMEYTAGASYRFAPGWAAGLEGRNNRIFANQDFGRETNSAWFFGPNIHYGAKAWWGTLTILPQVFGHPTTFGLDPNGSAVHDASRELGKHEKLEVRMRFGVNF